MAEYLLKHMGEASSLLNEKRLSLFLDYDGTLTGITGRPEDAYLTYHMRETLRSLSALYPLAIVSGRSLTDLKKHVGMKDIVYGGNHGLEISSADFTMTYDIGRPARADLESLKPKFMGLAGKFRGVILEDKGLTLTVHYRLLDSRSFVLFRESFDDMVLGTLARGNLKLGISKKAFEVKANVRWDKGKAVRWLLDRPMFVGTTPIYMGDDDTDRDAYRAIGTEGLSINVGRIVEEARYFLPAQSEVAVFLKRLLRQPAIPADLTRAI